MTATLKELIENPSDLCLRCGKVQPCEVIDHASGTEWKCKTCGAQTDFMHNEEPE